MILIIVTVLLFVVAGIGLYLTNSLYNANPTAQIRYSINKSISLLPDIHWSKSGDTRLMLDGYKKSEPYKPSRKNGYV